MFIKMRKKCRENYIKCTITEKDCAIAGLDDIIAAKEKQAAAKQTFVFHAAINEQTSDAIGHRARKRGFASLFAKEKQAAANKKGHGYKMDTFMDKLMQKRNAQGMIDANTAADAAKMEMLQRQAAEYETLLQEMRKVNLKTAENTEQMQKAIQAGIQKIEAFQADNSAQAVTEEFLSQMQKQMEESFHKECVKVYRNVQASMAEELSKQADVLAAKQKENGKNQKKLMPAAIITILLVVADILIQLFNIVLPL